MADEMAPVVLHLYDLSQGMAARMSMPLLGKQIDYIPHTGIVVYGYEYFFGGGVQKLRPSLVPAHFGVSPIRAIPLGSTAIDQESFEEFLRGIQHRFTPATYNLLKHNCNHFTDECAQFLLGEGIPSEIRDLPEVFLSTPLGQSIAPMIQQMTDRMGENIDPFAAGAGTVAGAPAAAPAPAPAAPAAPSRASASASSSAAATAAASSGILRGKGSPRVASFIAAMAPFRKLLLSVSATLDASSGGAAPLDEAQAELLDDGCAALHLEFGKPATEAEGEQCRAAMAAMLAGGRWVAFHALVATMVRTWPARARPAALFLARCCVLRGDGAAYFVEEARPGVMGADSSLALAARWLAADELPATSATAALGLLQNTAATAEGAAAMSRAPLAGLAVGATMHVLASASASGTARRSAAAALHNLALACPAEADASGELPEDTTLLLLGLVECLGRPEGDEEVLELVALALGRLLKRAGAMAAALAASMDAGPALDAAAAKASGTARAACQASRAML